MADALFLVLRKIAVTLGEAALENIGTEVAEAAPILTDFEHGMKKIEDELSILLAFIGQVSVQKVSDKALNAWLNQVRDAAHQVEDIVDEYAYLTTQAMHTSSFFKRKFQQIKNIAAWQKLASQINQVESRIQRLSEMRDRYGISVGLDRSNKFQNPKQLCLSDSAYLTDDCEIVGNVSEIVRLTQWLLQEKQERTLIAIFGMGGVGKTTIASNAYKNQQVRTTFDCRVWITVSQTYQVEELLKEIIYQLKDQTSSMASDFMTMSRMRLVEVIQSYLQDKKYIIILDDVWDKDAWSFLNYAFVRNNRGSKVLLTTRRRDISSLAVDNYIIELKTLNSAESWKLFCKKAFRALKDNMCPEHLRSWAEKIVAKCQGLPLAIVTIGSVLSYRELEEQEWTFFYNQLSWQLANNPELNWISNVLSTSLHDLPSYLRSCFLYCSLHPEDYRLKRKRISKLWIAEGLVEERGDGTTMEEVAECYLAELTLRSLLQITERNSWGRAKTFVMHDLVREVTLDIAKMEKFGIAYGDVGMSSGPHEARRLCIKRGAQSFNSLAASRLRSFILFETEVPCSWIHDMLSNCRLLRVLCLRFANIEEVPSIITELYNLRYLDFSYTKVRKIPPSFRKLVNLQVLDLRFSHVDELPQEITSLYNLRHLYAAVLYDRQERSLNCISATKIPGNISNLKNLQTLGLLLANKDLVSQLGNLTLMRTLFVTKVRQSYSEDLQSSLIKMPKLSKLGIFSYDMDEIIDLKILKPLPNLKALALAGKLEEGVFPHVFSKFEKMTWLKLNWSNLKKDPIGSLSHMLNLSLLYLNGAYGGEQLTFSSGWFPKLTFLKLAHMEHLSWIEIEDGTMMGLRHLELVGLGNLKAIPKGIKHIRTLEQMCLISMSDELVESLQGSGSHIVQHIPSIHKCESTDSQAVSNFNFVRHLALKFGSGATPAHMWVPTPPSSRANY